MTARVVVVGASAGGLATAEALRRQASTGPSPLSVTSPTSAERVREAVTAPADVTAPVSPFRGSGQRGRLGQGGGDHDGPVTALLVVGGVLVPQRAHPAGQAAPDLRARGHGAHHPGFRDARPWCRPSLRGAAPGPLASIYSSVAFGSRSFTG